MMIAFPATERYRSIVDDWDEFLAYSARPLPTCVWVNTRRTSRSEVSAWLTDEGIPHEPVPWHPDALRIEAGADVGNGLTYLAGLVHLQEEASLLPVAALRPVAGDRVLDLCAAPGTKSVHAAAAVGPNGLVIANDRSGARLNVLRTSMHRLGMLNVATTVGDAAVFSAREGSFDVVIADVPCSCEGTSRKHPEVLVNSSLARSSSLAVRQKAILSRGIELCRRGGRIVYSTCTYAPEENEEVVDDVLSTHADLRILPVTLPPLVHSPGLTMWNGRRLHSDLEHALRVWPHQNDTGGFFVALLEKQA